MSNFLSSVSVLQFTKQDIQQYFLTPLFTGEDMRAQFTVMDNVRGDVKLDFFGPVENITRADTGVGFTGSTGMSYTQKTLSIAHLVSEAEINGKVFRDSVKGYLLGQGYKEDDIAAAPDDILIQAVLNIFSQGVKRDVIRQGWFSDVYAETYSSGVRTGTADVNNNAYTGHWPRLIADLRDSVIDSTQKVTIAPTTAAVAQKETQTLASTTAGTITLTISGVAYSQAYATSVAATVTAWYTANVAALKARNIKVTNPSSGALTFEAYNPGEGFTIVATSAGTGGSWTQSSVTANVQASAGMAAGTALTTFQNMRAAATPEMLELMATGSVTLHITQSLFNNYKNSLQAIGGAETSYQLLQNGQKQYMWDGIPIMAHPEWDNYIVNKFGNVYPHRALLTDTRNLVIGCDGKGNDAEVETWYNPDHQYRRFRAKHICGTQYVHAKYFVIALG